jgi:hypothetical protein
MHSSLNSKADDQGGWLLFHFCFKCWFDAFNFCKALNGSDFFLMHFIFGLIDLFHMLCIFFSTKSIICSICLNCIYILKKNSPCGNRYFYKLTYVLFLFQLVPGSGFRVKRWVVLAFAQISRTYGYLASYVFFS